MSFMERQPMPGDSPGLPDHAPTGWVVVGAGPGAKHRIFEGGAPGRTRTPDSLVRGKGPEAPKE